MYGESNCLTNAPPLRPGPLSAGALGGDCAPSAALDNVAQIAERIELIADRLQRFLDRFHGSPGTNAASAPQPVSGGHIGQLARVAVGVDRLERIASDLDQIG
jgi:hypothetical protein